MHSLPIFVKLRGEPVLLVGDGEGAAPKRRLLEAAGADILTDPEAGARLAVVAIDDENEAAAVAGRLRERGLLVNVVDKPRLCDFSFPAIVDRSPVMLAIGTGGASATLSKTLRERIEAMLPERLGDIATAVKEMRGRVNRVLPSSDARRRFWDALMTPGAPLDPLLAAENAQEEIERALAKGETPQGGVLDIPVTSGDPDDLTLKQLRWLSRADLVLSEPGVPASILNRARRDAERGTLTGDEQAPAGKVVAVLRKHD